ncbi:hypothetical protein [Chlorobium sp.]|jgi:hypothetical protein|uniref:hypothetical protein n=1 Tax=Chlorobium sp. TaxID=1095 RepID=UPI003C398315|nr:hypothetical protein [Chlorobiaceae bacterium]NTW94824.1 hypothetical protein [Chlorobiaceae bacterium]
MNQSFAKLWNITFLVVGPLWALFVWMVWTSGQLRTPQQEILFFSVVIPGFILIYLSGFLIAKRHARKQGPASS